MSGFDSEKITLFAKTDTRGQQLPFGIKAKDRQRHMYVIGKTGMGKSTLLENMAAQDILNGEGMAFIDPHGSAIEVLLEYIPEDRLDDVVYFAPFDMENPVAFNIMEDVGIDTRHLVVSGLMSTFKKIWEDAWSARMEYILTNALLALIEYPGTTLLSVNRMLADKAYRDKVIANVKDPAVKAYWIDEFNNYTERFAAEALPAIQNKIGQFTGNPLIRNIIGQPKSSFDVRKMMDERKILLINLSKGLVGETNADLIGSMLITKIYLAAMSRAELPPAQMKQMPNFYFYVDEFQSFANSTFANILSEARKYHLNLIIAHQYVAQMEEKIRDAVFGNVGTTVAFRTGPFDAEVLETVFAPQFEAVDLVNLGMYQVCLTLMIDGVGSPPFSATTLPPVQTPPKSHKHMAIKRSQQNYSRPRAEVEQQVIDSHAPEERLETAAENGHGNKGGFTKPSTYFKVGTDKGFAKQKEQLKNGGSIKRGPAQTPPGTGAKKPEEKNNKPQTDQKPKENQPDRNRGQSQKPPHPEKTPQDLRAILAGMTANTSSASKVDQSKESEIKPKPKTEGSKESGTNANTSNQNQSRAPGGDKPQHTAQQPDRNRGQSQKPRHPEKTPQDLRSILSGMTTDASPTKAAEQTKVSEAPARPKNQAQQPAAKAQTKESVSETRNQPRPEQKNDRSEIAHNREAKPEGRSENRNQSVQKDSTETKKEDLKSALAALVVEAAHTPEPKTVSHNNQPKEMSDLQGQRPQREVESREKPQSEQSKPSSQTSATSPLHTQPRSQPQLQQPQPPVEPVIESASTAMVSSEVKQSDYTQIGGSRQPAFTPVAQVEQPDISKVKQMLRTSGKERPPGL